jgi:hypothetical protein
MNLISSPVLCFSYLLFNVYSYALLSLAVLIHDHHVVSIYYSGSFPLALFSSLPPCSIRFF